MTPSLEPYSLVVLVSYSWTSHIQNCELKQTSFLYKLPSVGYSVTVTENDLESDKIILFVSTSLSTVLLPSS
jgi:hypothetical protein